MPIAVFPKPITVPMMGISFAMPSAIRLSAKTSAKEIVTFCKSLSLRVCSRESDNVFSSDILVFHITWKSLVGKAKMNLADVRFYTK